jgi:hypothetical protein
MLKSNLVCDELGEVTALWAAVVVASIVASEPLVILVHELGHAAGARLGGLVPIQVRVGTRGRQLTRFEVGATTVIVHANLFSGGDTDSVARSPRPRLSWVLFAAGGALANALVGVACAWAWKNPFALGLAVANGLAALGNLHSHDGAHLARLIRREWTPINRSSVH